MPTPHHQRLLRATATVAAIGLLATACTSGTASTTTSTTTTTPAQTTTTTEPRSYDFGAVSDLLGGFVDDRGLEGAGLVVVDREDGVVHEEDWGSFDADRVTLIASASKMLTAGVLLRLDDEDILDLDAPVADVVEWGAANPDITPAQLISNSSGLVGIFPDPVFIPYICQFIPDPTLQDCAEAIFTTTEDDDQVIAPDTQFRYGGGQWQVAGAVAEAASGLSWAELMEQTYLEPCGLDAGSLGFSNSISVMGDGVNYPSEFDGDPTSLPATENPSIEAGAYATPGAFARLLQMLLNDGACPGGEQVLSPEAIERMVVDRVAGYGGNAAPGLGYGLGWWIDRGRDLAYSSGAYGATPALDLANGYAFYLVFEANDTTWGAVAMPLADAIETAVLAARG